MTSPTLSFIAVAVGLLAKCLSLTGEFSQQSSKHREEVASLQKAISALDREKDALQDDVDQKTEKLVVLQEELSKKVRATTELIVTT